jgi:hypothetical protein
VVDLDGGEGLEVDARASLPEAPQEVRIVMEGQAGVEAADDVDLADARPGGGLRAGEGLVQGHRERAGRAVRPGVAAEVAAEDADVRVVEVEVADEGGAAAVAGLADAVGERAEGEEVGVAEEADAVLEGETLPRF